MPLFEYSLWDFFLMCLGLVFLLVDIALDIYAVVSFYQEEAYVSLGVLLLFLLGSSVLVQAYSWLWYGYDDFKMKTDFEKRLSICQLRLLHMLQLGIYLRIHGPLDIISQQWPFFCVEGHAGVMEISVSSYFKWTTVPKDFAVYMSHDLGMLRLIESFSESCPQLVLMLTIILQRKQLDPETVLKALASTAAVAFSVTMYHRNLRSFLLDRNNQSLVSSAAYFTWNLVLLSSRLSALALFASVLPCFIFTHFICSWLVLVFIAWRCGTKFMDGPRGEWLYRATVGLIWYFTWFNVVEGKTRYRTVLYHGYQLADISLLCGLWCWTISTGRSDLEISHFTAIGVAVGVVVSYFLGLLFKMIYYGCFHPNVASRELRGVVTETSESEEGANVEIPLSGDVTDSCKDPIAAAYGDASLSDVTDRSCPSPPARSVECCNKRMRKLAENFYS